MLGDEVDGVEHAALARLELARVHPAHQPPERRRRPVDRAAPRHDRRDDDADDVPARERQKAASVPEPVEGGGGGGEADGEGFAHLVEAPQPRPRRHDRQRGARAPRAKPLAAREDGAADDLHAEEEGQHEDDEDEVGDEVEPPQHEPRARSDRAVNLEQHQHQHCARRRECEAKSRAGILLGVFRMSAEKDAADEVKGQRGEADEARHREGGRTTSRANLRGAISGEQLPTSRERRSASGQQGHRA